MRSYEWWIKTIFLNMCTDVSQLYAVCHFLHLPEDYFGTLPAMQVAVKMPTSSREDAKTLAIRRVQAEALLTSLGVDDPKLDINSFSPDSVKSMVSLSLLSHEDLEELEFRAWNHIPAKKQRRQRARARARNWPQSARWPSVPTNTKTADALARMTLGLAW